MSFTTRIKFLNGSNNNNSNNGNKKKKANEMTLSKVSPVVTTSPSNSENPGEETEKYVEIDGIKFKITESEDDEADGEHNEDAVSTASSSHDLQKAKKRKTNQDAKKKQQQKLKKEQKQQQQQQQQQQERQDNKQKDDSMLKVNKRMVSLGKFEANTALYPVCRAWMVNEQESKYIDLDYLFTQYVKRPDNGLKLLKALIDDDISCISLMPAPVTKEIELNAAMQPESRIPNAEVLGSKMLGNKDVLNKIVKRLETDDTEDCPSTVGLLRDHLQRWKRVKVNWKKHTRAYDEERYGINFAILDTMFKMQMRK